MSRRRRRRVLAAAARARRRGRLRERAGQLAGAGAAPGRRRARTRALPPGPVDGSNPLDLVRDFVFASGSSTDRHGAARRFLAPDGRGLGRRRQPHRARRAVRHGARRPGAPDPARGTTTIRIRGTAIGRLTASGAFEPDQAVFQQDVTVVRRDGQWRISRAARPASCVPLSIFRDNYRPVRTWFVDPVRRLAVADLRYVPERAGPGAGRAGRGAAAGRAVRGAAGRRGLAAPAGRAAALERDDERRTAR